MYLNHVGWSHRRFQGALWKWSRTRHHALKKNYPNSVFKNTNQHCKRFSVFRSPPKHCSRTKRKSHTNSSMYRHVPMRFTKSASCEISYLIGLFVESFSILILKNGVTSVMSCFLQVFLPWKIYIFHAVDWILRFVNFICCVVIVIISNAVFYGIWWSFQPNIHAAVKSAGKLTPFKYYIGWSNHD